jgi:small subunit ribosomal protein S1
VGQVIDVKVLKLDRERGKISLGVKQTKPDPWTLAEQNYEIGSLVDGTVTHLTNFGAFVELEEGLEGLVHVSDLSWDKRIDHPREVVNVGDRVTVKVLGVDSAEKKMALGLKQTQPDPWVKLMDQHRVGDTITGEVQEITNFGVFVNLAPGIDGLVHVSELDNEYVPHPEKVTSVGETIEARIVEIDEDRRRVRLSVKQLKEQEEKRKPPKKEEPPPAQQSSEDQEILMRDFIGEKVREQLRREFTNH